MGHKVAWHIIATAADQGYSTLSDLSDLFDDVAATKTTAPGELLFQDGTNGFNAQSSKLHSIRLAHAISIPIPFTDDGLAAKLSLRSWTHRFV